MIAHAGLSEVSVAEIEAARKVFPVATVQNHYNLVDRQSEAVLEYCEKHAIGFIPWFPLAAGDLATPGGPLDKIAHAHKVSPGADGAGLALEAQPGDAADSRHLESEAPGRECRGGGNNPVGRGV